jgi:hypothetical protein
VPAERAASWSFFEYAKGQELVNEHMPAGSLPAHANPAARPPARVSQTVPAWMLADLLLAGRRAPSLSPVLGLLAELAEREQCCFRGTEPAMSLIVGRRGVDRDSVHRERWRGSRKALTDRIGPVS